MAIEDIFRALEKQAEQECRDILNAADLQAAAIIDEARQEAERIRQRRLESIEEPLQARANAVVNEARLEVKRALAAVREETLEQVFDQARDKLASLRGTSRYERVFQALAEEALDGVSASYEVLVDPADVELAERVVGAVRPGGTVLGNLSTIGGLVVATRDGRVRRHNTFESRLESVRSIAQAEIAEIISR